MKNTPIYEPIAIIGIGCRFPGGATTPGRFWNLLAEGVDTIRDVPPDRFDKDALYSTEAKIPGRIVSKSGAFVDDIDQFDADFFGISAREATSMDPQQRLLLECAVEAVEDAGLSLHRLAGTNTAVYVGSFNNDYEMRMYYRSKRLDLYSVIGGGRYSMANRISYILDARGPSMQVDTACSSSLVALELACQKLRTGGSDIALVGGCNLVINPWLNICLSQSGVLARGGRCQFGSAARDGYIRADAVAVISLRPLSAALREGNPIYALVHEVGSNNDGATSGSLVYPSAESQLQLMTEVWRRAGITPDDIQYIEAHGTGTQAGDAVEMAAVGSALRSRGPDKGPCWVGSVKSNIGHSEGGSGMASIIKTALSLHHRLIPPSLHCAPPDPRIPWNDLSVRVVQKLSAWPDPTRPLWAAVNSFGMTGTNAHAVLGEAPAEPPRAPSGRSWFLLPVTAKTPEALQARARNLADCLDAEPPTVAAVHDICRTAACHRTHFTERRVLMGRSRSDLCDQLRQLSVIRPAPAASLRQEDHASATAFVFSGQGAQWPRMGVELARSEALFRETLEEVDELWRKHSSDSLLEALHRPEATSRLEETRLAQPTIFAVQVGLLRLLTSWGVRAQAVVGHSVGEIAAAHAAGILDLPAAVRLLERRATRMQSETGRGAMASFRCSAEVLDPHLPPSLTIAAFNDPMGTLVSGPETALAELCQRMAALGVESTPVRVAFAFHSPAMAPAKQALERDLDWVRPEARASLAMYSTVYGARVAPDTLNGAYWGRNVLEPVRFMQAIQEMERDGYSTFIELSPHAVLSRSIQATVGEKCRSRVVSTLRRGRDDLEAMTLAVEHLFRMGYPLDWSRMQDEAARCVRLPPYPFQRKSYWIEESPDPSLSDATARPPPAAASTRAEPPPMPVDEANSTRSQREVLDFLLTTAAHVFVIPPRSLRPDLEISLLAPDSLAFLELMGQVEASMGVRLSMQTIQRRARTLTDLAALIVDPSEASAAGPHTAAPALDPAWSAEVGQSYDRAFAGLPVVRERLRIGEHDIETFSVGEGSPVVLLPAWQAMVTGWAPVMRRISAKHRVVGLHYPGYGMSTGPMLRIDELVSLVKAALERLELRAPSVMGWSLGGLIAQRLSVRYPVKSLTLVNTTACLEASDSAGEMRRLMAELQADFERSTEALGRLDRAERAALFDSIRATDRAEVFLHYAELILGYDNRENLKDIEAPTLVIAGGRDGITTAEHGRILASGIRGARLLVLPDAGHYIPLLHAAWLVEQWMMG